MYVYNEVKNSYYIKLINENCLSQFICYFIDCFKYNQIHENNADLRISVQIMRVQDLITKKQEQLPQNKIYQGC